MFYFLDRGTVLFHRIQQSNRLVQVAHGVDAKITVITMDTFWFQVVNHSLHVFFGIYYKTI